jgi:hypothetical protein
MVKKVPKTFEQTTFVKFHAGEKHVGVIVNQLFYVIDSYSYEANERVTLRMLGNKVQLKHKMTGEFETLSYCFSI